MSSARETASPDDRSRGLRRRQRSLLAQVVWVLCVVESGLVLVVLPWTLLWDNNYFFSLQPQHSAFWLGNHLRGAVSGFGMVTLWIGTGYLKRVMAAVFGGRTMSMRHRIDDVVDG